jgi:SAM-dependent methyltransferase
MSNQDIYNTRSVARSWVGSILQQPEVYIFIKYARDIVEQKVIDIGCGAGRTSYFLRRMTPDYVGTDYAAEMVEVCRERFPGTRFEVCDVRDMTIFPTSSQGCVIFSFNGLGCVDHAGRMKGLSEIHRVLGPNGLFIFSAHNRNFVGAARTPKLRFHCNPYRMARSFIGWWKIDRRNHLINKPNEVECDEYEIRNDSSHRWRMMHYYISKSQQKVQLASSGFELLEMVDWNGEILDESDDDREIGTIYYVARKITRD